MLASKTTSGFVLCFGSSWALLDEAAQVHYVHDLFNEITPKAQKSGWELEDYRFLTKLGLALALGVGSMYFLNAVDLRIP